MSSPQVGDVGNRLARCCAIVALPVVLQRGGLDSWATGPAPFSDERVTADIEGRGTYFDDRICRALYGGEVPLRWHRVPKRSEALAEYRGLEVEAVELGHVRFAENRPNARLIIHGRISSGDPVRTLADFARLPPLASGEIREWYEELSRGAARVDRETKRATTFSFLTPADELQSPFPAGYEDWTAEEQWLWLLATATPFEDYPPDPGLRQEFAASILHLSRDWSALVLRDGVGFLGRRPDRGAEDPFFNSAEMYFRSIYLDALLLGMIQRAALVAIADDVAGLGDPLRHPDAVHELERRLTEFRNVYWWTHLSGHGPANELAAAYGRQHRLPELERQVLGEIGDYSRQAQTAAADRTSALLGVLTLIGLPLGAVIGVFQVLGVDSPLALAAAVLGAILVSTVIVATVARPLIEPLLRALRR